MDIIDRLVRNLNNNLGLYTTIGWIASLIYISKLNITNLGNTFITSVAGLLAFVAIFYTVIVVSEFLTKLNRINQTDINNLKTQARSLSRKEQSELNSGKYEEIVEICNKKINIYNELSNVSNRKINKFLFISAFLLILIMIINLDFIPSTIYNFTNYKPYLLVTMLWSVIKNIVRIILLFYKVYLD